MGRYGENKLYFCISCHADPASGQKGLLFIIENKTRYLHCDQCIFVALRG
jgi:hypothetical protein